MCETQLLAGSCSDSSRLLVQQRSGAAQPADGARSNAAGRAAGSREAGTGSLELHGHALDLVAAPAAAGFSQASAGGVSAAALLGAQLQLGHCWCLAQRSAPKRPAIHTHAHKHSRRAPAVPLTRRSPGSQRRRPRWLQCPSQCPCWGRGSRTCSCPGGSSRPHRCRRTKPCPSASCRRPGCRRAWLPAWNGAARPGRDAGAGLRRGRQKWPSVVVKRGPSIRRLGGARSRSWAGACPAPRWREGPRAAPGDRGGAGGGS